MNFKLPKLAAGSNVSSRTRSTILLHQGCFVLISTRRVQPLKILRCKKELFYAFLGLLACLGSQFFEKGPAIIASWFAATDTMWNDGAMSRAVDVRSMHWYSHYRHTVFNMVQSCFEDDGAAGEQRSI